MGFSPGRQKPHIFLSPGRPGRGPRHAIKRGPIGEAASGRGFRAAGGGTCAWGVAGGGVCGARSRPLDRCTGTSGGVRLINGQALPPFICTLSAAITTEARGRGHRGGGPRASPGPLLRPRPIAERSVHVFGPTRLGCPRVSVARGCGASTPAFQGPGIRSAGTLSSRASRPTPRSRSTGPFVAARPASSAATSGLA